MAIRKEDADGNLWHQVEGQDITRYTQTTATNQRGRERKRTVSAANQDLEEQQGGTGECCTEIDIIFFIIIEHCTLLISICVL